MNMKKKYIQPKAISYTLEVENDLLSLSEVHNEEGTGIQRSKEFGEFEDPMDEEDDDFE